MRGLILYVVCRGCDVVLKVAQLPRKDSSVTRKDSSVTRKDSSVTREDTTFMTFDNACALRQVPTQRTLTMSRSWLFVQ